MNDFSLYTTYLAWCPLNIIWTSNNFFVKKQSLPQNFFLEGFSYKNDWKITSYISKQYISFKLTLKVPEKLQLYGLYVYYVMHICDFGMLRVKPKMYTHTHKKWIK